MVGLSLFEGFRWKPKFRVITAFYKEYSRRKVYVKKHLARVGFNFRFLFLKIRVEIPTSFYAFETCFNYFLGYKKFFYSGV